jgi:hypothetical protein
MDQFLTGLGDVGIIITIVGVAIMALVGVGFTTWMRKK